MRTHRLAILALLVACKTSAQLSVAPYSEDLSVHRIHAQAENKTDSIEQEYVPMEGHIGVEMDSISKMVYARNKEGKYVDGYVIQVYSGTSRNEARESLTKMQDFYPELTPNISYRQPAFRVKGGKFTRQLEAHRVYKEVKKDFPNAMLIPERFKLIYE